MRIPPRLVACYDEYVAVTPGDSARVDQEVTVWQGKVVGSALVMGSAPSDMTAADQCALTGDTVTEVRRPANRDTAFADAPNQLSVAQCAEPCAPIPPQASAIVSWYTLAAVAPNAGEPIGPHEDVACIECAIPRSLEPKQVWRWSWSGEPLCAHCATVLELEGELRGWAALRAGA